MPPQESALLPTADCAIALARTSISPLLGWLDAGFMKLLRGLVEAFFGCHHGDLSRVFTIKKRTYQVCFDCGRELDYSWEQMHTVDPNALDKTLCAARKAQARASGGPLIGKRLLAS
jgi:hypothetical protein